MSDTITLPRADYEALIERIEDAEDKLALTLTTPQAAYLPLDQAQRLWHGEHPLRVWREYRGLTGSALAEVSGVQQSYISDIERRRKPGSVDALAKLARALGVAIEQIIPETT